MIQSGRHSLRVVFSRAYRFDEVAEMAESLPAGVGTDGWLEYPATLISDVNGAGTQIAFVPPPSNSALIDPIITSSRWLTPADETAIVIGNHIPQRFPELQIGWFRGSSFRAWILKIVINTACDVLPRLKQRPT